MNNKFFCANCSLYEFNKKPSKDGKYHGHCGWNGCREDCKGNPSKAMIKNCKYNINKED